ncbi:unnamed protein product [Rotaria socialis]
MSYQLDEKRFYYINHNSPIRVWVWVYDLYFLTPTPTTSRLWDNGVKYLADALEHNTTLIQLHVQWNQIGDVGAHYLAHAIGNNKTLTTLNLRSNKITTTGAQHFLNTLQNNQTLTTIYFDRNEALQSESNKSMEDYRIQWINWY